MTRISQPLWTPAVTALSQYHPVVVEGMGYYDPRDPQRVADHILEQLHRHWDSKETSLKPKLVVIQGDPKADRGISAITPLVAKQLSVSRGLVCLDPEIAAYHAPNADRENVILELKYRELTQILEATRPGSIEV